jgi:branched-chain amino acid transport system permease protein
VLIGNYKETYASDEALFRTPATRAWMGVAAVAAVLFPFVAGDYLLYLANLVAVLALGALGLNILIMGVGAYGTAVLASRFGLPFWISIPAGGALATGAGMVVGAPSLRIKGLYLAIATLSAQVIFEWVFTNWTSVTGGIRGLNVAPASIAGFRLDTDERMYFLILSVTVVHFLLASNLRRTRWGRAFVAVRDRDVAAEIVGVNLFRTKILAFMVSSYYAGIAGGLWVYFTKVVTPENFQLSLSIQFLAIVIVGGLGSIKGTVYGTIFMTLVPEMLKAGTGVARAFWPDAQSYLFPLRDVVFGLLIVVFLIFEPHGLAEIWNRIKRFFSLWPFKK